MFSWGDQVENLQHMRASYDRITQTVANAPSGFNGVQKLNLRPAEETLFVNSVQKFVEQDIRNESTYSRDMEDIYPLWTMISPHHKVSLVTDLVRGLILADTPLPPESILHHLAFLVLFEKVGSEIEIEIDMSEDYICAPDPHVNYLEQAEKLAALGRQSIRDENQSLKKQMKLGKKVKKVGGSKALEELAESQINVKKLKSSAVEHNLSHLISGAVEHNLSHLISGAADRDSEDETADSDSEDESESYCFTRRCFLDFLRERGRFFPSDGRCMNFYIIQGGQGALLPRETDNNSQKWEQLVSHSAGYLKITEKEHGLLTGALSEETWARTAMLHRIAKQNEAHFWKQWSPKKGLHSICTLILAVFRDGSADFINGEYWTEELSEQLIGEGILGFSWAEEQRQMGANFHNIYQRVACNWAVIWHKVMKKNGLNYKSYADRLKGLDEVFNTDELENLCAGLAMEETTTGLLETLPDNQMVLKLYDQLNKKMLLMPLWGFDTDLIAQTPEAYMSRRKVGRRSLCDNLGCKVEHSHSVETAMKKCGKCRIATYCCRECQVADWPTHKVNCKEWSALQEP